MNIKIILKAIKGFGCLVRQYNMYYKYLNPKYTHAHTYVVIY